MPSINKTKKFNIYADGQWYTQEEILNKYSPSEALIIIEESEGSEENERS